MLNQKMHAFYNFETERITHRKDKWIFTKNGKFGELIETADLAFIVEPIDSTNKILNKSITLWI